MSIGRDDRGRGMGKGRLGKSRKGLKERYEKKEGDLIRVVHVYIYKQILIFIGGLRIIWGREREGLGHGLYCCMDSSKPCKEFHLLKDVSFIWLIWFQVKTKVPRNKLSSRSWKCTKASQFIILTIYVQKMALTHHEGLKSWCASNEITMWEEITKSHMYLHVIFSKLI